MSYTYNPDEINRRELAPGVFLRTMWGEKIMMSVVEIAANSEGPMHQHPHEQAGMVLEGEFDFTIGGVTTRVKGIPTSSPEGWSTTSRLPISPRWRSIFSAHLGKTTSTEACD